MGRREAVTVLPVGTSLLRYRGGPLQWAWVLHRLAGLGVFLFLSLHVAGMVLLGFGQSTFDAVAALYQGPVARVLELLIAYGLLYHALNGLRVILVERVPRLATLSIARRLFLVQLAIFAAAFAAVGSLMLWSLEDEPFHHSAAAAAAVVVAFLAVPPAAVVAVRALIARVRPPRLEVTGNHRAALERARAAGVGSGASAGLAKWRTVRVAGLCLVVLALLHFFLEHFDLTVEWISYASIASRWSGGDQAVLFASFWRVYDLGLLVLALGHGALGVDTVMGDYVHRPRARAVLRGLLVGLFVVLALAGGWVAVTVGAAGG
jgi:succinate dehydrogenase / fumarate reductase, cytochrome b subunit